MTDINKLIKTTTERIDAQLAVNNYKGYLDTVEEAIYEAMRIAMEDVFDDMEKVKDKHIARTHE